MPTNPGWEPRATGATARRSPRTRPRRPRSRPGAAASGVGRLPPEPGLWPRRSLVDGERRHDHVERDQRPSLELERLAVARYLPNGDRGEEQCPDVDRRELEAQRVPE